MFEELAGRVTVGPIVKWPGAPTPDAHRRHSPFSAKLSQTLRLLDTELYNLGATVIRIQVAMREGDFRNDGLPRANARAEHPGIIVSFDPDGVSADRMEFATDVFRDWKDNLRAIALGLEALRKVDRYGITNGRQQYAGFRALPSGAHDNTEGLHTAEQAIGWLRESGLSQAASPELMLRDAIKATHPDRGGDDPEAFRRVMRAKELIEG